MFKERKSPKLLGGGPEPPWASRLLRDCLLKSITCYFCRSCSRKNDLLSVWSFARYSLQNSRVANITRYLIYNKFTFNKALINKLIPLRLKLEVYSKPCQTSKMERFCENSQQLKATNYFYKTLHIWCFTGFWIRLWKLYTSLADFIFVVVILAHVLVLLLHLFYFSHSIDFFASQ